MVDKSGKSIDDAIRGIMRKEEMLLGPGEWQTLASKPICLQDVRDAIETLRKANKQRSPYRASSEEEERDG